MTEYIYLFFAIMFGSFVQGVTGFGVVLVSLPLLSFVFDIKLLIPLICLTALIINGILSFQLRKNLDGKRFLIMLGASVFGLPLGVYALKTFSEAVLTLGLGILILLFTAYMRFTPRPTKELHLAWGGMAGFIGGILGGSIGANGPPIIMYLTLQPWNRDKIKSTMVTYFLFASVFNSASHAVSGLITMDVLKAFTIAVPATLLGIGAGVFCYKRINDTIYRKLASLLVFFLGLAMVVKTLV
ncbi:sulfite exporter TauE/SafE family protein [Salidesulfovibrio onnuriiensis]|uniref:sulfite exporter TauE/SafE family protein n=1 Tax=Salidesulfovibrio onnuriiensis TaxID=2583823 RepID=UPI0011CA63AC|nr:sulfite exporter TauE/SafE family protein [Salidesulfovibrio onnuriiensis]